MPEQIIDLLINYGTHPEQAVDLRDENALLAALGRPHFDERELNALFTQDREQILGTIGMDTLISQATLVLEGEEEEEEPDDEEDKGKGAI